MRLIDRIFPKAENFRDFSPPEGELPRKAGPFIWIFVKALRWSIGIGVICKMIAGGLMSLEPLFFGRLVDAFNKTSNQSAWLVALPIVVWYILSCQIGTRVADQMQNIIGSMFRPVLIMIVRRRLANYLFSHSYRYFQDDFAGRLAGKVMEMPQAINDIVGTTVSQLVWYIVNVTISIILLCTLSWQFGFVGILYYIITFALWRFLIPIISCYAGYSALQMQLLRGRYLDSITNVLLVKLFNREHHEDDLISTSMKAFGSAAQTEGRQGNKLWGGQEAVNAIFQIAIITLGVIGFRQGWLTAGQVTTALTLGLSCTLNIWWLLTIAMGYFTNIATINEALSTIVVPAEVQDAPALTAFAPPTYDVAFDAVTFAYPARSVFSDFTLKIPQGQRVGLVGPSGAGKSTLVQLVLRLFDVRAGAIRIGGQDIRDVAQSDLRHAIAVIPQSTDLMHRSIRDNIAYGDLNASEAQIVEAAKKSFIHDTILGLKDQHGNSGYDALVGERGVKLSGGQRQRIAIARAFLKNAPILILDEATSALDSESERLIQESLAELFRGRTVIVIAHRLSTISHLDRIVVLDHGTIIEDDRHAALIAAGGLYARLWQLQSAGFIGEATDS